MGYGEGYAGGYGPDVPGGMAGVILEVAFATDPGAAPTWTDISPYLREFTVHRGKTGELDRYAAGRATFVLANEDRRFDPVYTSSPYSPNVVPMRKVRLRSTWAGTTYDVFTGYVDGWEQTYQHPAEARCVLSATDALKVLANIELPPSPQAAEVLADAPRVWYRLGDPVGSTQALDAVAGVAASVFATHGSPMPVFGGSGLQINDVDTSMSVAGPGYAGVELPASVAISGTSPVFTIEMLVRIGTLELNKALFRQIDPITFFSDIGLTMSSTSLGKVEFRFVTSAGIGNTVTSSVTLAAGVTYHVAATFDGSNQKLYVDGVDVTTGAAAFTTPVINANLSRIGAGFPGVAASATAVYDEVVIYPTALSAARIAAHNAAARTAWSGETSGVRIGRLLDAAGWSATDRNIDTGVAVLQSADLGGNVLAALQKVEETEQGRLFIAGDGRVRFIARDKLLQPPYTTSQATFGDSGSELEYEDLTYRYDDALIFNEVVVSRANGTVQTVKDTTSQTRYLRRTRVLDGLLHTSDTTSIDLANWIIAHYKDPILRVVGLSLHPTAGNESTHFPQVLAREPADRVTARRKPQNLGTVIDQSVAIEGIEHTVTAVDWVTKWNLSPAETEAYWIVGVAGASEVGQTTRVGF